MKILLMKLFFPQQFCYSNKHGTSKCEQMRRSCRKKASIHISKRVQKQRAEHYKFVANKVEWYIRKEKANKRFQCSSHSLINKEATRLA
jgi:hypothetical protein